jgi:hypothetical protein
MSSEAPVEITTNTDLLRVIEEVSQTRRPRIVSRDHEPVAVISPVRKHSSPRRPSGADIAATQAAAGAWRGLVDVARFKRENRRQKLVSTRSPVEL